MIVVCPIARVSTSVGVVTRQSLISRRSCNRSRPFGHFTSKTIPLHSVYNSLKDDKPRGFGKLDENHRIQDKVKEQHSIALAATQVIAALLQAGDDTENVRKVAHEYVDSLNEEFFHIGGAYLNMAKSDGDKVVAEKLEILLKIAMEVKNSTLRPEIQILNSLMNAESELKIKQILNTAKAGSVISMNEFYFFHLLDRMTGDVENSFEGNPQRNATLQKCKAVKQAALERLTPDLRTKLRETKSAQ